MQIIRATECHAKPFSGNFIRGTITCSDWFLWNDIIVCLMSWMAIKAKLPIVIVRLNGVASFGPTPSFDIIFQYYTQRITSCAQNCTIKESSWCNNKSDDENKQPNEMDIKKKTYQKANVCRQQAILKMNRRKLFDRVFLLFSAKKLLKREKKVKESTKPRRFIATCKVYWLESDNRLHRKCWRLLIETVQSSRASYSSAWNCRRPKRFSVI